jgi:prephenate dehydratase
MVLVAFQGELGAFSEEAVERAFANGKPVACRENRDVARQVARGQVAAGVLPVENTLAGSVPASYDAILAEPTLHIVREVVIPIHHCIMGCRGASLDTMRTIESHPIALAQCANWFAAHPSIHQRAAYDTAGAARDVAAARDVTRGALASRIAATRYGLELLAENVEDRGDNQTRFVVLELAPARMVANSAAKTVLMLEVDNRPGSLVRVLTPLSKRELNLTKLESRPTGEPWTYHFVLEFEHRAGDPVVAAALHDVEREAVSMRVVGTYSRE